MTQPTQSERGSAAVELAVSLPVMVLLILLAFSATELFWNKRHLDDVASEAAHFATVASDEPRSPRPSGTRPTPEAVAAFVGEISELPVLEVAVSPDPTTIHPGEEVTVEVVLKHDVGPLATLVNGLNALIGNDPPFPDGAMQLNSVVTAVKE